MTKRRCAGQDAEAGRRQSECGSGCCNVIPAAGYGSFAVAANLLAVLLSNDVRIPLGIVSPDQGRLQLPHQPSSAGASSTRNSPGGSPMQPKIQKR